MSWFHILSYTFLSPLCFLIPVSGLLVSYSENPSFILVYYSQKGLFLTLFTFSIASFFSMLGIMGVYKGVQRIVKGPAVVTLNVNNGQLTIKEGGQRDRYVIEEIERIWFEVETLNAMIMTKQIKLRTRKGVVRVLLELDTLAGVINNDGALAVADVLIKAHPGIKLARPTKRRKAA